MKKVTVIGLGYVGLPLALTFWDAGFEVFGLDVREKYIKELSMGKVKMAEALRGESIESILKKAVESGRFHLTTDSSIALDYDNQRIVLTVGIPLKNNVADPGDLEKALQTLGEHIRKGALIVARSTLIVGYTRSFIKPRLEKFSNLSADTDFDLAFSSERMAENVAFEELVGMITPVAGLTTKATKRAAELLREMGVKNVLEASCPEAVETAKVFENIARDVNIALANEYANFCTAYGLDTKEVLALVRTHKRVTFLHHPGPGVGGHCLPQAMFYLKPTADDVGVALPVIINARIANDNQPIHIARIATKWLLAKEIKNPKITIIGLSMKDFSTDGRLSPAIAIVEELIKDKTINLVCWDPICDIDTSKYLMAKTLEQAVKDANVVIITARQQPMPEGISSINTLNGISKSCLLLDCRFAFDREEAISFGLEYIAL